MACRADEPRRSSFSSWKPRVGVVTGVLCLVASLLWRLLAGPGCPEPWRPLLDWKLDAASTRRRKLYAANDAPKALRALGDDILGIGVYLSEMSFEDQSALVRPMLKRLLHFDAGVSGQSSTWSAIRKVKEATLGCDFASHAMVLVETSSRVSTVEKNCKNVLMISAVKNGTGLVQELPLNLTRKSIYPDPVRPFVRLNESVRVAELGDIVRSEIKRGYGVFGRNCRHFAFDLYASILELSGTSQQAWWQCPDY